MEKSINLSEVRRDLVERLQQPGMFDAYKSCVKILTDMGKKDNTVYLSCPENIYCVSVVDLAKVSAIVDIMPLILLTGRLATFSKLLEETRPEGKQIIVVSRKKHTLQN